MGLSRAYSAQTTLLDAVPITIEADVGRGLHAFSVVGLPDKAVEESRDRVAAAIKNSGFTSPKSSNYKIVIALSPADLRKEGPAFDLAIAVAYLVAVGELSAETEGRLFIGELALNGALQSVRGILPIAASAKRRGIKEIFVPRENAREAALISGLNVYGADTLSDVLAHISTKRVEHLPDTHLRVQPPTKLPPAAHIKDASLDAIRGQHAAKRGLEIAIAGGHNVAFSGPAGTGKSMLARAAAAIAPPLDLDDALDVTSIHSVAGILDTDIITAPPMRAPHHTASYPAVIGGGNTPRPGEVTLAHRGILFLDEFPEFDRRVIESLREPLEEGQVRVSRSSGTATFPADITLIAAMNPCPCGNYGSDRPCTCAPYALERYRRKMTGPIVDRIDIWTDVPRVSAAQMTAETSPGDDETRAARTRVEQARQRQRARFSDKPARLRTNRHMSPREVDAMLAAVPAVRDTLAGAIDTLSLSARSYHRVAKVARTIADLAGSDEFKEEHVLEALQYRQRTET